MESTATATTAVQDRKPPRARHGASRSGKEIGPPLILVFLACGMVVQIGGPT